MFPMTITVSNVAQLNAIMAALALGAPAVQPPSAPTVAAQPEATKPEPAKAQAEKVEEKKSADAPNPAATAHTQPTATVAVDAAPEKKDEPSVTFDTLKTAFLALVNTNREKAKAVLAQFGLPTKLSEAKPEQYAAIYDAIKAA